MRVVCEQDPENPHFRESSKSEEVRVRVHNQILTLRCFLGQRQGLSLESDEDNEEGREYQQNHLNIIPGAQPAQGGTTNTPSDDDGDTDDFIVDDEDGPKHIDLPTNFSSSGIQPLASSFKVVFQLFVHVSCLEPHLRGEGMKRLVGWFSLTVTVREKSDKGTRREYRARRILPKRTPSAASQTDIHPRFICVFTVESGIQKTVGDISRVRGCDNRARNLLRRL